MARRRNGETEQLGLMGQDDFLQSPRNFIPRLLFSSVPLIQLLLLNACTRLIQIEELNENREFQKLTGTGREMCLAMFDVVFPCFTRPDLPTLPFDVFKPGLLVGPTEAVHKHADVITSRVVH